MVVNTVIPLYLLGFGGVDERKKERWISVDFGSFWLKNGQMFYTYMGV